MVDVLIAIPSFRRPKSLERLLRGIEKLNTRANVAVLVADNDAERREAMQTCDAVRTRGYRWPIEAIVVRERGIANVRNALVGHALRHHDREFIAMLDDDEEPDTKWLDELLRVQAETGADALNGSTKRVFENDPGAWAVHCDGVSDVFAPTGNIGIIEGIALLVILLVEPDGVAGAIDRLLGKRTDRWAAALRSRVQELRSRGGGSVGRGGSVGSGAGV